MVRVMVMEGQRRWGQSQVLENLSHQDMKSQRLDDRSSKWSLGETEEPPQTVILQPRYLAQGLIPHIHSGLR